MNQATQKNRRNRRPASNNQQAVQTRSSQSRDADRQATRTSKTSGPKPAPLSREEQYAADVDFLFAHATELW